MSLTMNIKNIRVLLTRFSQSGVKRLKLVCTNSLLTAHIAIPTTRDLFASKVHRDKLYHPVKDKTLRLRDL